MKRVIKNNICAFESFVRIDKNDYLSCFVCNIIDFLDLEKTTVTKMKLNYQHIKVLFIKENDCQNHLFEPSTFSKIIRDPNKSFI